MSSSGALFDSINRELPVMMYESPSFNGFENVGIRGKSITELGELIINTINTYNEQCKEKYVNAMRSLKQKMEQDNIKFFKEQFNIQ